MIELFEVNDELSAKDTPLEESRLKEVNAEVGEQFEVPANVKAVVVVSVGVAPEARLAKQYMFVAEVSKFHAFTFQSVSSHVKPW